MNNLSRNNDIRSSNHWAIVSLYFSSSDVFSRTDADTNKYQCCSFMLRLNQCFIQAHGVLLYTFILNHHGLPPQILDFWLLQQIQVYGPDSTFWINCLNQICLCWEKGGNLIIIIYIICVNSCHTNSMLVYCTAWKKTKKQKHSKVFHSGFSMTLCLWNTSRQNEP